LIRDFLTEKVKRREKEKAQNNLSSAPFFPFLVFGSVFGKTIFLFSKKGEGSFFEVHFVQVKI